MEPRLRRLFAQFGPAVIWGDLQNHIRSNESRLQSAEPLTQNVTAISYVPFPGVRRITCFSRGPTIRDVSSCFCSRHLSPTSGIRELLIVKLSMRRFFFKISRKAPSKNIRHSIFPLTDCYPSPLNYRCFPKSVCTYVAFQ